MQKMTTCLWFDGNGEEAVDFYATVFKDAKKGKVAYYGKYMPKMEGQVLTVEFEMLGQSFVALNGGTGHPFTDAISFTVNCDTQEEIDYYWEKLTADGGKEIQCSWLKDKFGLSWQIAWSKMGALVANPETSPRVMAAMMKMVKLDIATLQKAAEGK